MGRVDISQFDWRKPKEMDGDLEWVEVKGRQGGQSCGDEAGTGKSTGGQKWISIAYGALRITVGKGYPDSSLAELIRGLG
jgi:hypothetical protein